MAYLLCTSAAVAFSNPIETTLELLLDEFGYDKGPSLLSSLVLIEGTLKHHGIECRPPIGTGGLTDTRVLFRQSGQSLEGALDEISQMESQNVEFKSSLILDRKKFIHDPGQSIENYRSANVLHSSLKTIAAFANTSGGSLYIGVEDNGNICGINEELRITGKNKPDADSWDQFLRNSIKSNFDKGDIVSSYVYTRCFNFKSKIFFQLKIAPRRQLSFLKFGDAWTLYIRTGTQTVSIPFKDMESYFSVERRY